MAAGGAGVHHKATYRDKHPFTLTSTVNFLGHLGDVLKVCDGAGTERLQCSRGRESKVN